MDSDGIFSEDRVNRGLYTPLFGLDIINGAIKTKSLYQSPGDWNLFVGAVCSVATWYIFYIWYRLVHFRATVDFSQFIPSQRYVSPEIEIPLYLIGIVVYFLLVPLNYLLIRKLVRRYSPEIRILSTGSFLRMASILLAIVYFFSLNIGKYATTKTVFIIFLLVFIAIQIVHFFVADRVSGLLKRLSLVYDWLTVILFAVINAYVFFSVLFSLPLKKLIIFNLGEYNFSYLDFNWWQFILVFITLIILLIAVIKKPFIIHIGISRILLYPAALILILSVMSVMVPHLNTDFNYFLGPVNDVLGGKAVLVNSPSQYGLLNIYFLAGLFKFIPLTYNNFFIMNFVFTAAQYFLVFILLQKWFNNTVISLLGIFLILQQNYSLLIANILLYPQAGFLRFGPGILFSIFIFLKEKNSPSSVLLKVVEYLLLGFTVFWGFDTGFYFLGAYLFYIAVKSFSYKKPLMKLLMMLLKSVVITVVILSMFFILISAFTYFSVGSWPDWYHYIASTVLFTNGYGMVPLNPLGPYLLYIGIYIGILSYIIYTILSRKIGNRHDLAILSYLVMYGILQFIYFMGRSHPNNIHYVVIPLILIGCWLINKVIMTIKNRNFDFNNTVVLFLSFNGILLAILFLSVIITAGAVKMYQNFIYREIGMPSIDGIYETGGDKQTLAYLNSYFQTIPVYSRKLAIISTKDTLFLIKTASVNIIDSNNLPYNVTYADLNKLGNQLMAKKPDTVFIDKDNQSDQVETLKNFLTQKYHMEENIGSLDRWKRNK